MNEVRTASFTGPNIFQVRLYLFARGRFIAGWFFGLIGEHSLRVVLLVATSCLAGAENVQTVSPLRPAWQDAAHFLATDANKSFTQARSHPEVNVGERELGEAITLLNVQPRTAGNILRAREILGKYAAEASAEETSIFARYFLARVYEAFEEPAQPEKALAIYKELVDRYSGDSLAEHSASRLVFIELYDDISSKERDRRFAELEELAPKLKSTMGRRDYHLNMGNAYIDFGGSPVKAIAHLLAAETDGITNRDVEAATWIAIAELGRGEGEIDLARAYYRKFLAKYERDNRHYTIQQRLEALPLAK